MKKVLAVIILVSLLAATIIVIGFTRDQTDRTQEIPKLLWKKKVVGTFDEFAGVTVVNKTVYTVGKTMDNAPVTALEAETGEIIWQTEVGSCDSTPMIVDNRLFVINCMWDDFTVRDVDQPVDKERIWCLNKEKGTVIWFNDSVLPDGGGPVSSAPAKNRIFACSTKDIYAKKPIGRVQSFRSDNGGLVWTSSYVGASTGGIFFENRYIVSGTNKLAAYDADNGERIWANKEIKSWDSLPVVAKDGVLYIGGGYGKLPLTLFAVNPNNGDTLWSWRAENNRELTLTTPVIHNEKVYFGGYSNLYCVDLKTHSLVWKRGGGGEGPYSTPVIANEIIYYGSTTLEEGEPDYIFARDIDTGNLIWKYEIDTTGRLQGIFSQPTISNNRLYFTADDGYLRCFSIP
ncbi:hypothetical protein AKJ38_02890 [candidate division MSBL1 archaeon SCGC-AAA259I14]|uniref:Pyrrolo-quinoline quinone repeat domain-containing protein n=4 Tax=candidate division MSBL1 TaxID=215777 RepID=A0A133UR28_9EURY|nr:hypothetical protein AKJ61_02790 [candidate division MSBL1 archaeon SCGC-AAA259B11]KXA92390.1 hypothetical protein AKJ66_04240 [candidate division MSBL1 archaeon SCGC-AAA259E22]KXA96665.1 hypothetical protein AKJ38_02890 [candidate division MSBL1 archaeon SCGC-AAA259I14]